MLASFRKSFVEVEEIPLETFTPSLISTQDVEEYVLVSFLAERERHNAIDSETYKKVLELLGREEGMIPEGIHCMKGARDESLDTVKKERDSLRCELALVKNELGAVYMELERVKAENQRKTDELRAAH